MFVATRRRSRGRAGRAVTAGGATLLDVQWTTPHLISLGAVDVPRDEYQQLLAEAVLRPLPVVFSGAQE